MQLSPEVPVELTIVVDSDWAGCRTTRRSTSGCVISLFGCPIHSFSRTQGTIATSSGEAELYAIGSGVSEGLGIMNLLQESKLRTKVAMTVMTDSTSAKAMATRIGVTKLTKHIQLRFLYMQDLVANNIVKIKKVGTKENPADVLTKVVPTAVLHYHLQNVGLKTDYIDTDVSMNMITTRTMSKERGIIVGAYYDHNSRLRTQNSREHHGAQAYYIQGHMHDRPKSLHTYCKLICSVTARTKLRVWACVWLLVYYAKYYNACFLLWMMKGPTTTGASSSSQLPGGAPLLSTLRGTFSGDDLTNSLLLRSGSVAGQARLVS